MWPAAFLQKLQFRAYSWVCYRALLFNRWHVYSYIIVHGLSNYPRRARSALGVDTVLTLDVCLYVCMLVL